MAEGEAVRQAEALCELSRALSPDEELEPTPMIGAGTPQCSRHHDSGAAVPWEGIPQGVLFYNWIFAICQPKQQRQVLYFKACRRLSELCT